MLQIDKSLEECAQMCGASWTFRTRTVTIPAAAAGPDRRLAAAVHRQCARAWRLHPADGPAFQSDYAVDRGIVVRHQVRSSPRRWRLIQTLVVAVAMIVLVAVTPPRRRTSRRLGNSGNRYYASVTAGCPRTVVTADPADRGRSAGAVLRQRSGGARRQLQRAARRTTHPARPLRLRQDDHVACDRRTGAADRGRDSDRRRPGVFRPNAGSTSGPRSAVCRWCFSLTRSGRI